MVRSIYIIGICLLLISCTQQRQAVPTEFVPTELVRNTPTPRPTRIPQQAQATSTLTTIPTSGPMYDDLPALQALNEQAVPRNPIALAQAWGRINEPLEPRAPLDPQVGEQLVFWAINITTNTPFQITATLQVRTPHLALYVAEGVATDLVKLQQAASQWERDIWPQLAEWYPTVNMQEPITVLSGPIPGVGGYYSADNELPQSINRYSNERSMIFINSDGISLGSEDFLSVITHEMQHFLHQQVLRDSATWFNEGASMLSEYVTGTGSDSLAEMYLEDPDIQLNSWADSPSNALKHYGGAELWMRYFYDRLNQNLPLGELAAQDAGDDLFVWHDLLQTTVGDSGTIDDIFATWATANVLNDPTVENGQYSYTGLPRTIQPQPSSQSNSTTVAQFGADYLLWEPSETERTIIWQGATNVRLIDAPTEAGERVWWSGRGDNRVSTLTTEIQVPETGATLTYQAWFDIEPDYDYAYLTISTDQGQTWRSLRTSASTDTDPLGLNFDLGWTGKRAEWFTDSIQLNQWGGQEILVRFWMINDDAYNAQGLALDDIQLEPAQPLQWEAQGWQEITNNIVQDWELRLILETEKNISVEELPISDGSTEWTIPVGAKAILVITATSPETTLPAQYQYEQTS